MTISIPADDSAHHSKQSGAPMLRFLAALALGASASFASAATITYNFTGASQGSFQEDGSYVFDAEAGFRYSPTFGMVADASSGSASFVLDVARYTDQVGLSGVTEFFQENPPSPWLTSTSTVSGPLFSRTMTTPGTVSSGFGGVIPELSGFGEGILLMFDLVRNISESTVDELGRPISARFESVFNQVVLTGDVVLGLVEGKEVPLGIGSQAEGFIEQVQDEDFIQYRYDDQGTLSVVSQLKTFRITRLPIATWDITVNQVPEPASLLLVSLGLALLTRREQTKR